jgi:type I restriction enzyme R subunit
MSESHIEQAALDILGNMGYETLFGPDIAPDGRTPERKSYKDVVLTERLERVIDRLNPSIPKDAQEDTAHI